MLYIQKFRIWNLEVPVLAERLKDSNQMMSPLLPVLLSHIMIIIGALWPYPKINLIQIVIVMMMMMMIMNLSLSLER
jgi:hypothetical protein